MNRFDRIVTILVQLQARRVVRGSVLAQELGVSLRTVYRDLRTLEQAGVPVCGEAGVGYSLPEGYLLSPVMFTREEATALLTAEKLAGRLTDDHTAHVASAAMDKLRAVMRRSDRDYLDRLSPHLQVRRSTPGRADLVGGPRAHQRLLKAIVTRRVVHLAYGAGEPDLPSERDVEPIGLYLGQHWHLVAFCRLRQDFRDFRLDRIEDLQLRDEVFAPRPETLQRYWAEQAERSPNETALVLFQPDAARRVRDTKHQYGWACEESAPDGSVEMTFSTGYLPLLAAWLLPQAGTVVVLSPPELRRQLHESAQRAHRYFCEEA